MNKEEEDKQVAGILLSIVTISSIGGGLYLLYPLLGWKGIIGLMLVLFANNIGLLRQIRNNG